MHPTRWLHGEVVSTALCVSSLLALLMTNLCLMCFLEGNAPYPIPVYDNANEDGGWKMLKIQENKVSITQYVSLEDTISSITVYGGEPPLSCIVLINPPSSLTPTLHATLSKIHQNVPITMASALDISQVLTKHQYLDFCMLSNCCCFCVGFQICPPICIASATSIAMPLVYRDGECTLARVFSTSVDNQTTATLQLFVGDHPLVKDNVEHGVIALKGLDPRPRGVGCIQVMAASFPNTQGFDNMLTVTVEQLIADGQKCPGMTSKMFIFCHFFPNTCDEERYIFDGQHGYKYMEVQSELPELISLQHM